jgi:hypothetical protein
VRPAVHIKTSIHARRRTTQGPNAADLFPRLLRLGTDRRARRDRVVAGKVVVPKLLSQDAVKERERHRRRRAHRRIDRPHFQPTRHRVIKITESRVHRRPVIGREDPSDHFRKREVLHPGGNVERTGSDAGSPEHDFVVDAGEHYEVIEGLRELIVCARVVVPESHAVHGVLRHEIVFAVIGGRTPELKVIRQRLDEAGVDVPPVRSHSCPNRYLLHKGQVLNDDLKRPIVSKASGAGWERVAERKAKFNWLFIASGFLYRSMVLCMPEILRQRD